MMPSVKNVKALVSLLFFISISIPLSNAQEAHSFGVWANVAVDKKINKKWSVEADAELRTISYVRLINRASIGVATDYKITKDWKAYLGYQLYNTLDAEYNNYQLRNRFTAGTAYDLDIGNFTFTLRERIQYTLKDRKNRMTDATTDDYRRFKSDWAWRNRLKVDFSLPKSPWKPAISAETFFSLNDYNFYKFRYILSLKYKISKQHAVEVFGVINTSPDDDDGYGKYILGAGYSFSL
ncbi:MAG TPA: DUF2490 domain-containing protein [Paludibacter sp.]|nr:DUF2490 domain-containing protein [Paludibacter sp.]HPM11238.1 DUF2490 domain-containing protein [Paludibacter sp.]